MTVDSQKHYRQSIRLKGYDYSQAGAYFVTITTHARLALLSEVDEGEIRLSRIGEIIEAAWLAMEDRYSTIQLDDYILMPDHLHAIAHIIEKAFVVDPYSTPPPSLGDVIGAFKSISAHDIILAVRRGDLLPFAGKIWQRNYYEHIIRNENELNRVQQYIRDNPIHRHEET